MPDLDMTQIQDFLKSFTADNIQPTKKPRFQDSPPVYQNEQFLIGVRKDKDIRYFTQVKLWVKPPSQNFPESALMLSLVNGKGSVFCKLNGIEELKALRDMLTLEIPKITKKLDEMVTLEKQFQLARAAFDATLASGVNGDEPEVE